MNKNSVITRGVLCALLIIFMYVSAACSISDDKKKKNNSTNYEDTTKVVNAKKKAFVDEAISFIKAAEEKYIEDQILGEGEISCYSVNDLLDTYLYRNSDETYSGVITKDSTGEWMIYFSNGKYSVDGKKQPIDVSDVTSGDKISKTSC